MELVLSRCGAEDPAAEAEAVHEGLAACASRFYRGEVWPLRHVFGIFSRFINGINDASGRVLTPAIVTTWMDCSGAIRCSCLKRVAFVAGLRDSAGDANCQHGRTLRAALNTLCRRLGVTLDNFRRAVPVLFSGDEPLPAGSTLAASGKAEAADDWDSEGPMETFRTGQSAVAVVISGAGLSKVPAPVRCARKSTHCAFCDSAAAFSCIHAVRSRGVRLESKPAKAGGGKTLDDVAVDDARSREAISPYNCMRSVEADEKACSLARQGKPCVLEPPASCPTCGKARADCKQKEDSGELLCSVGYCTMQVGSFYCNGTACQRWIFPDGRAAGVILLSATTAGTAVLLRDMARHMCRSGCTLGSCIKRWQDDWMDRRDSEVVPAVKGRKERSRVTITSLFWLAVRLMVKEPPKWAFSCSNCQDKDGRWRIVTADGIWLGFLKRLAKMGYVSPWEECKTVKQLVYAASIHPSEWARRFIRGMLKQPTKVVVLKAGHLNSAMRALAFLCPAALPNVREDTVSAEKQLAMSRLRVLLALIWDLDTAGLSLCDGIVVHIKKMIGPRCSLSTTQVAAHQATIEWLQAWSAGVRGLQGAVGGAGGAGGAGGVQVPAAGDDGEGEERLAGGAAHPVAGGANGQVVGGGDGGGGAANARGQRGAGRGGGERGARGPAAAAQRHHMDRTTNEPVDPRCLRPAIKALGLSVYRDILSFAISLAVDPVVNAFKPRHRAALSTLASTLDANDAGAALDGFLRQACGSLARGGAVNPDPVAADPLPADVPPAYNAPADAPPANAPPANAPPADAPAANNPPAYAPGAANPPSPDHLPVVNGAAAANPPLADPAPAPAIAGEAVGAARLLQESRMLSSFLVAVSSTAGTFEQLRAPVANVLLAVRSVVEDYHKVGVGEALSAMEYMSKWGPGVSPSELLARFRAEYPDDSNDPCVTGAWFPGMDRCRPGAFGKEEDPELGTCRKNYEAVHKFFFPGTFTICCACAHPKVIGFIVLDKREGPPALLNALLSYFAMLPHFVVYDFGCGALRSALGKLPWLLAVLVFVSDLFHIVNHLCSDSLHPHSHTPLDGANSVAHEQRNAPINRLKQTLRACGQDEYMAVLQLENVYYNVMAHARATSSYRLSDGYNFRRYYFSRSPCECGCGYQPSTPPVPAPASAGPAAPAAGAVDEEVEWPTEVGA